MIEDVRSRCENVKPTFATPQAASSKNGSFLERPSRPLIYAVSGRSLIMAVQHHPLDPTPNRQASNPALERSGQNQLVPTRPTATAATFVIIWFDVVNHLAVPMLRTQMPVPVQSQGVIQKARRRHDGSPFVRCEQPHDRPSGGDSSIPPVFYGPSLTHPPTHLTPAFPGWIFFCSVLVHCRGQQPVQGRPIQRGPVRLRRVNLRRFAPRLEEVPSRRQAGLPLSQHVPQSRTTS